MKILHILSQNELTGAEAYAISLVRRQLKAGHDVWMISDTLSLEVPEGARFISLPIDRRSFRYRIANILSIRKVVREFQPQVVHAHSRAASWVSRIAVLFGPALVSTIHGRQHWHTRFKQNDVYGERIIAICGHIRDHIVNDFGISPKKVDLIRNFIERDQYPWSDTSQSEKLRLGLIGRMSGPKGKIWGMLVREVLPDLMAEFPKLEVLIGGGAIDRLSPADRRSVENFLSAYPNRARFFGHSPHLATEFKEVDFVIGAGRIAIEALYSGKRVFGFGEYKPVGWITRSSLRTSLLSNFGDVGADRESGRWWPTEELWTQLRSGLMGNIQFDLQPEDLHRYLSETETIRQIDSVYRQAILGKKYRFGIPSLMFHKVVDGKFESKHRTFIDVRRFDRILGYLRIFGRTGITFSDLIAACEGKISFPKRPVLLTFDDGYRDSIRLATPLLRKRGMRAILYLLGDKTLRENEWDTRVDPSEPALELMGPADRQAVAREGVFEIGSHGLRHESLDSLSIAAREHEFTQSKANLEQEFGTEIHSYAYAYGNHSEADAETANRKGYAFAVGTDTHYGFEENIFRIFRANIFPEDGFFSVAKKSSPFYRLYFAGKRKLRTDRRNGTGIFSPNALRRRIFSFGALIFLTYAGFSVFQKTSVTAAVPRYRNVFGEVLEPCLPEDSDGFSLMDLCRSPSIEKDPANICISRPSSVSEGSRRECVSVETWTDLYSRGAPFLTIWPATNLRAISRLPESIRRGFFGQPRMATAINSDGI